jgi:hypothetical protein
MPDRLIDQVMPQIVGAKATLRERLTADGLDAGLSEQEIERILEALPPRLAQAECFLDRLTGLWRYEFGAPIYLEEKGNLLWGAHMWVPVQHLRRGLSCCLNRVPAVKRAAYVARLDNLEKHLDVLSEMIPMLNMNECVSVDFEIVGRGVGNRTLDWLVGPIGGREILLDVKNRSADLIQQMDQPDAGREMPAPQHDPALMFRGIERKLNPANSAVQLQGAWITTHLQQEAGELTAAFQALDPTKIHFAIFGHWEAGGCILVRNEVDREFLARLFGIEESDRFTFDR